MPTDGDSDVEIELAKAVLTPVGEYVRKKYDDELLFLIAIDVSILISVLGWDYYYIGKYNKIISETLEKLRMKLYFSAIASDFKLNS